MTFSLITRREAGEGVVGWVPGDVDHGAGFLAGKAGAFDRFLEPSVTGNIRSISPLPLLPLQPLQQLAAAFDGARHDDRISQ